MKKTIIYPLIAFIFLFVSGIFVFKGWINYRFLNAELCGHSRNIVLFKDGFAFEGSTQHDNDTYPSCFATWYDQYDNKFYRSTFWNVGNCESKEPVIVSYPDYHCEDSQFLHPTVL